MSESSGSSPIQGRNPRHNLLAIKLLSLGEHLHKRVIADNAPWWAEAGETWKKADDNDGERIDALQNEVIEMITHSDRANLFKLKSTDEINPLIVRMLAVVSFRGLLTEWTSMSIMSLVQATSIESDIEHLIEARRCAVALCQRGLLRYNVNGELGQTVWVTKQLVEFISDGVPLVIPPPAKESEQGKRPQGKPATEVKPGDK